MVNSLPGVELPQQHGVTPTVRAIVLSEFGGPEVMKVGRIEMPEPQPGEVLVRVLAAGVNRPDVAQRQGLYPPPPGASPILGLEVAGEVVALGEGAMRWRIGDRVCALTNGGGYADYVAVPETQSLPWPRGFSAIQAAALPEVLFTVWANVFGHGRLAPGETILVHGGSSGIGVAAITLAKAKGATVYATAGTDAKCRACEELGADHAINYRAQDFLERVLALTEGKGVDVILDMVGADYLDRNLQCLTMDGRLVLIAFLGGWIAREVDLSRFMTRRLTLTGSMMRPRTAAEKAHLADTLLREVWPILEAGRCTPVVDRVFPFEDVVGAHAYMESGSHIGKIVLEVAS